MKKGLALLGILMILAYWVFLKLVHGIMAGDFGLLMVLIVIIIITVRVMAIVGEDVLAIMDPIVIVVETVKECNKLNGRVQV